MQYTQNKSAPPELSSTHTHTGLFLREFIRATIKSRFAIKRKYQIGNKKNIIKHYIINRENRLKVCAKCKCTQELSIVSTTTTTCARSTQAHHQQRPSTFSFFHLYDIYASLYVDHHTHPSHRIENSFATNQSQERHTTRSHLIRDSRWNYDQIKRNQYKLNLFLEFYLFFFSCVCTSFLSEFQKNSIDSIKKKERYLA